ncbi:MAG: TetR/AcrR family transcriptional regulator [Actinobacteria bacterium]|nr:TetR/AcrR family transcriptional regulator [Actinomycetota bacterium]
MNSSPTRTFTLPEARNQGRDATELRILDATAELLQSGASLAGLSIGRIVEAAGVSRATFYLHFPDKRELVARLAQERLSEFGEITDPFLEKRDAGREELAEVMRQLVASWQLRAGVLAGLVELAEYDEAAREAWRSVVMGVAEMLAGALHKRRPELSDEQAQSLAEVVAWMGERVCHQMTGIGSDENDARRTAEAMTDAIWRIVTP